MFTAVQQFTNAYTTQQAAYAIKERVQCICEDVHTVQVTADRLRVETDITSLSDHTLTL